MSNIVNAILGNSKSDTESDAGGTDNTSSGQSFIRNPMKQRHSATMQEAQRIRSEGENILGQNVSGPDSGFTHIGARDNSHSGYGGSNQGRDSYGRDTASYGIAQGYAQSQDRSAENAYASNSYPTSSAAGGSGMSRGTAKEQVLPRGSQYVQGVTNASNVNSNIGITPGYAQSQDRSAENAYASNTYPTSSAAGNGMNRGTGNGQALPRGTQYVQIPTTAGPQGNVDSLGGIDQSQRVTTSSSPTRPLRDNTQNVSTSPTSSSRLARTSDEGHHHHNTSQQRSNVESLSSGVEHRHHHSIDDSTFDTTINPTTGHHYGTSGTVIGHYENPDVRTTSSTTSSDVYGGTGLRDDISGGSIHTTSSSFEHGAGIHAKQFSREARFADTRVGKTTIINAPVSSGRTERYESQFDVDERSSSELPPPVSPTNEPVDLKAKSRNLASTSTSPGVKFDTPSTTATKTSTRTSGGLHDHNIGEGLAVGCPACVASRDRASSQTQTSQTLSSQVPTSQPKTTASQAQTTQSQTQQTSQNQAFQVPPPGPTIMTTTTDTKVEEMPSPLHLRPGETVVEKETRVHRGIAPTDKKAGHTTQTTTNTFEREGDKSPNKGNLKHRGGGLSKILSPTTTAGKGGGIEGTGKESMTDKMMGNTEKTAGRLVFNADKVNHGEATAAGHLNPAKN
ncbi:hypothetical protein CPC08DRAFT_158964 [Agrocybe pediades]|nr:hypothetical protein CPC08DRAFT_158964 [Agrocybe pediades]